VTPSLIPGRLEKIAVSTEAEIVCVVRLMLMLTSVIHYIIHSVTDRNWKMLCIVCCWRCATGTWYKLLILSMEGAVLNEISVTVNQRQLQLEMSCFAVTSRNEVMHFSLSVHSTVSLYVVLIITRSGPDLGVSRGPWPRAPTSRGPHRNKCRID